LPHHRAHPGQNQARLHDELPDTSTRRARGPPRRPAQDVGEGATLGDFFAREEVATASGTSRRLDEGRQRRRDTRPTRDRRGQVLGLLGRDEPGHHPRLTVLLGDEGRGFSEGLAFLAAGAAEPTGRSSLSKRAASRRNSSQYGGGDGIGGHPVPPATRHSHHVSPPIPCRSGAVRRRVVKP
jgi:hypothetical protein